jgi:nitroreductase
MEFWEVVEGAGACRYYRADPVPRDVLARVLDAARYAPTGGNRQPVRFVAVCDAGKRRALAALYLPLWETYARGGRKAREALPDGRAKDAALRMLEGADHMARRLAEIPVLVVVCARTSELFATDAALGRLSVVGGASIYPAVQNLILAARAEGLGTALTTLLCAREAKVRELLGIPDEFLTAALVPLGYPAKPFPKRLRRRPLGEVAFVDTFGEPVEG